MKTVFFAYCNQIEGCLEVLEELERFFEKRGWNLVVPENALSIPLEHPMEVNEVLISKSDVVLVEVSSERPEMKVVYEKARENNAKVICIYKKSRGINPSLEGIVDNGYGYENARELVSVFEKIDDFTKN